MVEELVRRRDGPHDVVVDLAVLDRLEDRVARGAEPPFAPADEQGALRVRMELPDLAEELAAGATVQRLAREYDGDGLACRLDLRQVTAGLRGRGDAHDAVTAMLDRNQYGALAVVIPGSLKVEAKEDPAQAAFGLGRIPAGFDAGLSIAGLLKAMAVLVEHIKQYTTTEPGQQLRRLISPTGAYTVFMSNPSSPMVQAMIAAAPR